MKNIALKINNKEEADFCGQILNKLGIILFYDEYYTEGDKEYLYLNTKYGHHLFTHDYIIKPENKDNYIFANSWREFVINYLSNYYYKCESKQEKEQIIDSLNKRTISSKPIGMRYMRYCYCEVWHDNDIVFRAWRPKNKQKISLDNLLTLLQSINKFDELTNKTMEKLDSNKKHYVKINDKYELAAAKSYLETFFKDNDIDVEFCKNMFGQKELTFSFLSFDLCPCIINGYFVAQSEKCVSIQEFANWVKEKLNTNKTFTFSNGVVAKLNNDSDAIIIGCKEHSIEFFEKFANTLIIFNMSVTFDGKEYTKDDFRKFSYWLNKI